MKGEPSHFEIGVAEATRAKRFFADLLGWEFEAFGQGEAAVVRTPTVRGGLHDGVQQPSITIYFEVEDIDRAVDLVRSLGGKAEQPSPAEPGFGRFAHCEDDQGLRFGLNERPK